jgi:hypothetical protein
MAISWQQYFLFIGCATAAYYITIGLLYYRGEILYFLSTKKIFPQALPLSSNSPVVSEFNSDEKQGLMPYVHDLVNELQHTLSTSGRKRLIKEELIMSLQLLLKKYGMLNDTLFVQSINKFIESEAENSCSIHFNEQELKSLWLAIE